MLPPKRLLLMLTGLAVCLVLYQVYLFFLGGYDGLTPLPSEYWPGNAAGTGIREIPNVEPPVVRKLRQAFGPQAKEADRPILIHSVQHGIVLAAQKAFLNADGKLELEQVSIALFGKKKSESAAPDICTLQGDRAVVEFDKPLTSVRDVANRKPVAGRIEGRPDPATSKINQVHLRHYRRTANPDDDLHLYTDWLQYDDRQHRIWTEAAVEIVDGDPDTGKVTGIGLEVLLEAEPPSSEPGQKPKRSTITGVRSVELSRNVQMYFQIDGQAALFGSNSGRSTPEGLARTAETSARTTNSGAKSPSSDQAKKQARRSPVKVTAQGPFIYYVREERAEFHNQVNLIRIVPAQDTASSTQLLDELRCQSLTLQFRRKSRETKTQPENSEAAIELIAARAVGQPVEVAVESENLHATGTELVLDRVNNTGFLAGKPLEAVYEGHRLQIVGTLTLRASENQLRELREASARGPGTAWLRSSHQADQSPLIVRWREQMRLERDGSLERLLLSGNVLLEEPQRGSLRSDHLLLWFEITAPKATRTTKNTDSDQPVAAKPATGGSPSVPRAHIVSGPQMEKAVASRIPRCVEASGNVSFQSETFVVPHTDRLRVELHDEPQTQANSSKTDQGNSGSTPANPPASEQGGANTVWQRPAEHPAKPGENTGTKPARPPLVLRARTIEAVAAGSLTRADLRSVSAQGQVQVDQPPASPQDRALQIRCGLLHVQRSAHGDILRLEGTPVQPASVQFGQLAMRGPVIKLDQALNTVDVEGLGSMRLPARNDFQGNPLREPTEIVVDWNQSMFFDGRLAEFDGGVQAVQGNSRLACRRLALVLDRKVSFREQKNIDWHRNDPPAALSRLMCEQDVRLEKAVLEGDRYQLLHRIEARELAYDHETATLVAYGPGVVHVFQPAGDNWRRPSPLATPGQPPPGNNTPGSQPPQKISPGYKLTRIRYDGHMQASKAADKQTDIITFTGGVQLIHLSASTPDETVDPDRLPEDGLSLSCGELKITSRRLDNGVSAQELLALHGARVRAQHFYAHADRVALDEAKDLLVLEGTSGATLYRQKVPGGEYEPVRAKRIWFWRRDNRVRFDGTESIHINP